MSIIKQWDRLYTLDSKGKIRVFDCRIEDTVNTSEFLDSINEKLYSVITSTGLLGGKLIDQEELVKKGKNIGKTNETTPLSQAMLQADALWIGKTDEGYKSLQTIENRLREIGTPILDISEKYIDAYLKLVPEAAYTNSNWDELPMLAHPVKKVKRLEFPMLAQPKLNGVRCLSKRVLDIIPEMKLISRGGGYYKIPHIERQLVDLTLLLAVKGYNVTKLIFDGEIYKHGVPLQDISGAARKEEGVDLFASNNWLEYHIYDVIDLDNLKATQEEREELRENIKLLVLNNFLNIKFVHKQIITNEDQIKYLHNKWVGEGYEGLILRDLSSIYKFNERSIGLLKVKEFKDEEFEIVGYKVDDNKSIEESFVFVLKNNKPGTKTFDAKPTGTNAMRLNWYNLMINFPEKLLNKKATVRYFDRSVEGIPTMGHVRSELCEFLHIRPNGE